MFSFSPKFLSSSAEKAAAFPSPSIFFLCSSCKSAINLNAINAAATKPMTGKNLTKAPAMAVSGPKKAFAARPIFENRAGSPDFPAAVAIHPP